MFHFEVALPRGGNSGVLHGVGEEGAQSWHSGLEMQLLDDAVHPDGRQPLTRHGALYGLRPALPTDIEPLRFQRGMLRVDADGRVEHWLEGRCVLTYVRDDTALREAIANSKFAAYPGFACQHDGHLVLQHHGDAVRFRRLAVEVLE